MVTDPFRLMRAGAAFWAMLAEAQIVVALRMMGAAGLVAGGSASETRRMVAEKGPAFARSAQAATMAALAGKPPADVMLAAVRPLRRRTRANMRRLSGKAIRGR